MLWLLVICALLPIVYIYLIKPLQHWKRLQVPQYSVVKIYKDIIASIIPTEALPDAIRRVYNDFPDQRYFGGYQFISPCLCLRDPDLIKQITIKDFDHFTDHFSFVTEDSEPIWARNLFALSGEKWKGMRMILSPSFTSRKLKTVYPLIITCAKQLTSHFEKDDRETLDLEMKEVFKKFGNDVIATAAFGISFNSFEDPNNDFLIMGQKIFKFNLLTHLKVMFKLIAPKLANLLNIKAMNIEAVEYFENIITNHINDREQRGITRPDMIQLLLEAKKKSDNDDFVDEDEDESEMFKVIRDNHKIKKIKLTNEDMLSQAFLFFFAGFDTVSILMSFLAHHLALNPDVQEKLYEEIQEVAEGSDTDPTYEDLMKMKYLDMIISETLRISPISALTDRVCTKPYTIQPKNTNEHPVHLKVGDIVYISTYGLHTDPKYFPNPERFDPERFSDENKKNIIPGSYLPFGIGPRNCIGNRFALMEIKLLFYFILIKFKFVVIDKTQIPLKLAKSSVSVNAEKGYWVGLQKRFV